jgi:Xaa-Pro aminopeptidase
MFTALETIDPKELQSRHERCRQALAEILPHCHGLLVFSRLNIYYLSGHWGNGVFWLPLQGSPVFLARKGKERAQIEAPGLKLGTFRSFKELPALLQGLEEPLGSPLAVEKGGLSWSLGEMLGSRLPDYRLEDGSQALHQARAVKSDWELEKMELAGQRHHAVLYHDLPEVLRPGMSEWEISMVLWQAMFDRGHQGMMRMQNPGEEIFLGHVSAGDSANYPSVFNGPVGLRGVHPAQTQMGYAGQVWLKDSLLTIDGGFCLEGYHTDKTQVYWSGRELPDKARAGHEFCVAVQDWVAGQIRPGAIPSEIFERCWEWARKEGWEDGFMGLGGNKVYFIGHGIGLAIDEPPVIARGFKRPLEENMVLALEPKIGIPELGMVGVENSFVVTAEGGRSLTGEQWELLCLDSD